ncbi:dTDP-4-amino-4,6-dideoxygalactose transaminase [Pedobacter cryoconitis]|uniref:dTDP-4-amino-4,6-dideoxygalactose transaminase n=1 Tax=Pedobacter cryoconitis TaxID=188932 RepID=A0A7W8YV58_9SPHI|nr:DegT/DnrJ/EryC1/StrS family aminotransferase [Pedobacter cryoconitis]MBB5622334.1 dTDP-4-amino-4,6-dideoxygalactose transaminase [Pedobacter cryoconitis]
MINVSKPNLPDLEKYVKYLKGIWDRNWLTNNGPLVNELELRLKEYLEVPHLLFLGNGTIALQIAIKALELKGEVITTPFSYVATTSSLVWENCKPVFVDIDMQSFNIDPAKIESAITENTTGILATHVFGNPCDIDAIEEIARKHKLKVIYDAAHCFGTKYKGKSVFNYGDISTTSFHATKLFHSVEGGAVFTSSSELLKKMSYLRNFGHNGPEDFEGAGINGKNSEFHAAMGLANLDIVDDILASRKEQSLQYNQILSGLNVKTVNIESGSDFNYAYYPVLFDNEEALLKAIQVLNGHNIMPRRYFYPSLNTLKYLERQDVPISEDISKRVLCLPLYYGLSKEEIDFISRLLLRAQNN